MSELTVIDDEVHSVPGTIDDGRILIDVAALRLALGWELKPEGLCRGDICVPVADRGDLVVDGRIDVARVAGALGRPVVVDADAGIVAMGLPTDERRRALDGLEAPGFHLPDLEGTVHGLEEWQGKKKLLVTFASWCGCRYDLPGWQELHDELAAEDFTVIAVAIDNSPEDVRPWVDGITYPVLVDQNHLLTELYAISNVPTVVWIDADDRIVRPNGVAFGSDLFKDTGRVEKSRSDRGTGKVERTTHQSGDPGSERDPGGIPRPVQQSHLPREHRQRPPPDAAIHRQAQPGSHHRNRHPCLDH